MQLQNYKVITDKRVIEFARIPLYFHIVNRNDPLRFQVKNHMNNTVKFLI